jgi:predicted phage terminase large subunit-like protein
MFTQWALGKNKKNKIITVSYNDTLAIRFSTVVRDGIDATKIDQSLFIFSDIFPDVRIKEGDAAKQIWSLEDSYFSYLGAGFGGTITGIGCSIGIIDDPIKSDKEALNEVHLEKQWSWYTDTFLSRIEEGGTMLCPPLMSFETYSRKKRRTSTGIFHANYNQEPIDIQGRLYSGFKTYDAIDSDKFERIINYTDTADEGVDFLAAFSGGVIDGYIYITDIYYTDEPMETTEPELTRRLILHSVRECLIESNNGGRGFARNVILKLKAAKARKCNVTWFHQSKNKRTRILVNAASICERIIMPEGWDKKYPAVYKALMTYQRKGKNANDDAPDALTGLYEFAIGEVKGKKKARVGKRSDIPGI